MITNGTLNTITKGASEATLNITPSSDGAYALTQVLYKKFGSALFTTGVTYVGVSSVAGDVVQTGLTDGQFYEFVIVTADSSSRYSLPSAIKCAYIGEIESELYQLLNNAKTFISNSTIFQTWVGANDATEALAYIHIYDFDYEDAVSIEYPFALISFDDNYNSNREDSETFIAEGSVSVMLVASSTDVEGRNESSEFVQFVQSVGKIKTELQLLESESGLLSVRNIQFGQKPSFTQDEQENQEIMCELILEVGV